MMIWPFNKNTNPPVEPWDRSSSFQLQMRYETEGAEAYLVGTDRDANPYDREKASMGWNHWQYGWDNQQGKSDPLVSAESGMIVMYSTSPLPPQNLPMMIRKSEFDRQKKDRSR